MADTENAGSRKLEQMSYGHDNIVETAVDVITGGHEDLDEAVDEKYDLLDEYYRMQAQVQTDLQGADAAAVQAELEENLANNERARKKEDRSVTTSQVVAGTLNTVAAVSGAAGGFKAGGSSISEALRSTRAYTQFSQKFANTAIGKGLAKLGSTTIVKGARAAIKGAATVLEAPGYAAGKITNKVGSWIARDGAKLSTFQSVLGGFMKSRAGAAVAGAAVTTFATEHFITGPWLDKIDDRLKKQIGEMDTLVNYLSKEDTESVTEMDEEKAAIATDYVQGLQSLEADYQAGKISDAEYQQKMTELVQNNTDQLQAVSDKYSEYGDYILNEGSARKVAEYDAAAGTDTDKQSEKTVVQSLYEKYPEIKAEVDAANNASKYGACSNEFTAFLATINATVIKYAPFVATVEAMVLKAGDTIFDAVRDAVKHEDVQSAYQGKDVEDITDSIKNFSEEHLAAKEEGREHLANIVSEIESADDLQLAKQQESEQKDTQEAGVTTEAEPQMG